MTDAIAIRDYLGYGGRDHRQRTFEASLAWNDEILEATHDYIQWWFPLTEPSAFNSEAPVATRAEFRELQRDPKVNAGIERALHRMLRFYGLRFDLSGVTLKTDEWNQRSPNWAYRCTHNDLRITRILKSLCLLGHRAQSQSLFTALENIIQEERSSDGQAPLRFWREAVQ